MAKLQGFSPIITTSSLKHEAWLKSLGATHVIDRSLPAADILADLPKISGDKPILYAYDAISSPETESMAYDALAPGGGLVSTEPFPVAALTEKVARDGGSKKLVRPLALLQHPGNKAVGVELYKRLTEWLETGVVVVSLPSSGFRVTELMKWVAEQGQGAPRWFDGHPRGMRALEERQGQRREARSPHSGDPLKIP